MAATGGILADPRAAHSHIFGTSIFFRISLLFSHSLSRVLENCGRLFERLFRIEWSCPNALPTHSGRLKPWTPIFPIISHSHSILGLLLHPPLLRPSPPYTPPLSWNAKMPYLPSRTVFCCDCNARNSGETNRESRRLLVESSYPVVQCASFICCKPYLEPSSTLYPRPDSCLENTIEPLLISRVDDQESLVCHSRAPVATLSDLGWERFQWCFHFVEPRCYVTPRVLGDRVSYIKRCPGLSIDSPNSRKRPIRLSSEPVSTLSFALCIHFSKLST